jgi:hypothetical protein
MAVLCEVISVVTRRDSIDAFYKGGWDAFQTDVPNATMCTDGELVRVGFMSPDAVGIYIKTLEANGLQFQSKEELLEPSSSSRAVSDIVVIDQLQGPTTPCEWVGFGKHPFSKKGGEAPLGEVSMCWLFEGERNREAGADTKRIKMSLATPHGWDYEKSSSLQFVDDAELESRYEFLRTENGLEVFRDIKTGKEVYKSADNPND